MGKIIIFDKARHRKTMDFGKSDLQQTEEVLKSLNKIIDERHNKNDFVPPYRSNENERG